MSGICSVWVRPVPRRGAASAAALALGMAAGTLSADPVESALGLGDWRMDIARLTTESLSGEAAFLVDDCGMINVEIVSDISGLTTRISAPGGQPVIDPASVSQLGGAYRFFQVSDEPDPRCVLIPWTCQPGFHHLYSFPSLGCGEYVVQFTASDGLGGETEGAVISKFVTDSPVGATVAVSSSLVKFGEDVTIAAVVFEDDAAVTLADVTAHVHLEDSDTYDQLTLADDGTGADFAVGDGVYSGVYTPGEVGTYSVMVEISGTTSQQVAFARQAGAYFRVHVPRAVFSPDPALSDNGVDDNQNGYYDRVTISANVDVSVAGDFGLIVALGIGEDQSLTAMVQMSLEVGNEQPMSVDFLAADLVSAGENGPYTVTDVQLLFYDDSPESEGAVLIDRLFEPGYQTQAYDLSQFERPPIVVRYDEITSTAVDTDEPPDGTYDELRFVAPMDLLNEGTYEYSAALYGPCGDDIYAEIDRIGGSFDVDPGWTNPVQLTLVFDGERIGTSGLDGPYSLREFLISGPASLVAWVVGETEQAYTASQFDGFTGVPDCDGNTIPDECDIAIDPTMDCDFDGILDAEGCDPDVPIGACCDAQTGACIDGVSQCSCAEEFVAAANCDTGCSFACCWSSGNCSDTLRASCEAMGWGSVPGSLCAANVMCYDACVGGAGCCFEPRAYGMTGCANPTCCLTVCNTPGYEHCCTTWWKDDCAQLAVDNNCYQEDPPPDCNDNDRLDPCEIEDGSSQDCNGNGVPDECDIASGESIDCDENGIPDECVAAATGACCDEEAGFCTEGISLCDCTGRFVEGATCATLDPPCHFACCQADGACENLNAFDCDLCDGVLAPGGITCEEEGFACPTCAGTVGCCFKPDDEPGCTDAACCMAVCLLDSFCCEVTWDAICAEQANDICENGGPHVCGPAVATLEVFYAGRFGKCIGGNRDGLDCSTDDNCIGTPPIPDGICGFPEQPDPSRSFLAAGTTATIDNITNYIRGITGIRVFFDDVVSFATTPDAAFSFEWSERPECVGGSNHGQPCNPDNPDDECILGGGVCDVNVFSPVTDAGSAITVTPSEQSGATVVDIVLADNHVRARWLKVTIDSTQVTADGVELDGEMSGNPVVLLSGDGTPGGDAVFYLGNVPGDVDGNRETELTDPFLIRNCTCFNPFVFVPITEAYDVDKDVKVELSDVGAARADVNPFFTLPLITP